MRLIFYLVNRKRKGMTLVETLVALVIMSLGVIVMARITASKVQETASIDSQYTLLSIDATLSDIYHDFQIAKEIKVSPEEDDTSTSTSTSDRIVSLAFDLGDGIVHLYDWFSETGKFYYNGIEQFSCTEFEVRYNSDNLYVAIRTPNEKRLELDVFR